MVDCSNWVFSAGCGIRSNRKLTRRRFSSSPCYERNAVFLNGSAATTMVDRADSIVSTSSPTTRMPPENEVLTAFEDVLVSALSLLLTCFFIFLPEVIMALLRMNRLKR